MMPDTNTILEQLDWHTLTCQCTKHQCDQPATHQIEFHAVDYCNQTTENGGQLNPFGNYVMILCEPCYIALAVGVEHQVERMNRHGRRTCLACGAPVQILADVIREARTL